MWWDAVAGVIVEKVYSFLESKASQFYEFEDQFQELKDELRYIQSFLEDASNAKPKQHNKTLKAITAKLRQLAYETEEIIEDHELQLHKAESWKISKLSFGSSASSLNRFGQMGKRLEKIIQEMKKVRERMTGYLVPALCLPSHSQGNTANRSLSYPMLLDEDEMVGLDVQSAQIKQWILDRNDSLTVIGIVGMGGIGKTALAQKIFHDAQDYFGIKLFVTVSQSFKFEELLKTLLVKLNVGKAYLRGDARDLLRELRGKLDREYLLVLDDVWDTNEGLWWESLKSGLPKVHRSCVIVTTRKEEVVKSMGAVEERIHRPNLLSDDESWSLFSKIAFQRDGGDCPDSSLEDIGRKIVSKCGRLPLAIKIIGGMMAAKGDSIHKWQQTLQQLEQGLSLSSKESKDGLLISTLELSYEDLPSHLKPCMLCFALIPEDYECSMLDMINWWIGEGFVWERDGRTTLEIGEQYYIELLSRCLLIGQRKDNFGEKYISCRMHDIVHEMTRKIAREENFLGFRHGNRDMSIVPHRGSPKEGKSMKLWTLAVEDDDWEGFKCSLRKASCKLRVLHICLMAQAFHKKSWHEQGIGALHHLKYLNLDYNSPRELPDSFRELPNLLVLVLKSENLPRLPPSIATLEKLIILDVQDVGYLERMPDRLGKLSNLEKLCGYRPPNGRLEEGSCWAVELKKLTKLRKLGLLVDDEMEEGAWKVLAALPQLKVLQVRFEDNDRALQFDLLQLHPLRHLEELHVLHYPGESVPTWLDASAFPKLRLLTFEIGWSSCSAQDRDVSVSEYPADPPQERLLSLIANRIPNARIFLIFPPHRKPLHYSPTHGNR